jgi:ElaB/YqjD/DUF883 family membrane-anchored ribosome-binding protein
MNGANHDASHTTRDPDDIERDVRATRAEVSSTIDAIQSKLTPGQMMDQALSYMRTSLPADFGRNLTDSVRNNPVPVALVGIGLAWMMMSGRSGSVQHARRHEAAWGSTSAAGESDSWSGGSASGQSGGSAMSGTMSSIGDKAHQMADRTRAMAGSARERMSSGMESTRARMSDLSHRSRDSMLRARDSMSHMIDEQPLVLGALGIAVGAALGAALPVTQRENALMGGMRDDLMAKARDTARDYADRAAGKARDMGQRAADRAHEAVDQRSARAEV